MSLSPLLADIRLVWLAGFVVHCNVYNAALVRGVLLFSGKTFGVLHTYKSLLMFVDENSKHSVHADRSRTLVSLPLLDFLDLFRG